MRDVSADYLRKHLGEVLDKSYYTGAEVRVNRKSKCLGVFVPIDLYEKRQQMYREAFLRFMEEQRAAGEGEEFAEDEVMRDAVETVHEVRDTTKKHQ